MIVLMMHDGFNVIHDGLCFGNDPEPPYPLKTVRDDVSSSVAMRSVCCSLSRTPVSGATQASLMVPNSLIIEFSNSLVSSL
jgi:hypothetical protein